MRILNCRTCGKELVRLEKGLIFKHGLVAYCLACDPAKAKEAPVDFGDLFRGFAKK